MYRKEKPLALKSSTSALCNNLSILPNVEKGLINYAVVHKSVVNMVTASMDGSTVNHRQVVCKEPSATNSGATMVLQAKLVPTPTRTLLVITSQKGIQIFEADSATMLYWYALGDVNTEDAQCYFGRGICGIDGKTVCVGNHEGNILVFNIPARGTNLTLSDVLKGHDSAVCDLASEDDSMVSSDEMGNIIVWKLSGDTLKFSHRISGDRSPCSSLGLWGDLIVGGYGTGHLRVFSMSTGKIVAEVTAHARWINAINIARGSGLVLSVSEDTSVRIWKLTSGASPGIEYKESGGVDDLQLCGGQFIDADGRAFAVTGYDSNEIHFFK